MIKITIISSSLLERKYYLLILSFILSLLSVVKAAEISDDNSGKIFISGDAKFIVSEDTILHGHVVVVPARKIQNTFRKPKSKPLKAKSLEKKIRKMKNLSYDDTAKIIPSRSAEDFNTGTLRIKKLSILTRYDFKLYAVVINSIVILILYFFAIIFIRIYKCIIILVLDVGHNFQRPPPVY
ncbi:hypothetical protein [Chryseobacterium pennipullorum]|uniref:Uncharacterized protein n=1 Tax=Chryseobacterium pennipullorum TaxID=2258963 RepID=A0A3D9ATN5_9FLAO|nr:hypothetical protein [Chryseobacterium pennipullorum]REC44236.1 hypothetical protein DRF67_18075 [Chryseobacterium pennipullorum]